MYKTYHEWLEDHFNKRMKLLAFFVNQMTRDQMLEWAAKMPDNVKAEVKREILRLRGER